MLVFFKPNIIFHIDTIHFYDLLLQIEEAINTDHFVQDIYLKKISYFISMLYNLF